MRRAAVLVLALLAVLLAGAPGVAGAAEDGWSADRVLVVGVPGLVWDDVDPGRTPALWELADTSPVGAVSVRAARSTTCLLDGWATLGAGNRARFPAPDELLPMVPLPTVPLPGGTPGTAGEAGPSEAPTPAGPPASPELSHCGLQERLAQAGLADPLSAVRAVAEDGATARFGAEPGALGPPWGARRSSAGRRRWPSPHRASGSPARTACRPTAPRSPRCSSPARSPSSPSTAWSTPASRRPRAARPAPTPSAARRR
ncbi:hypothetical protein [Geodermatophilus normandii]|uniref:hypothetical protein n=1 Tax=Geodermatophilus normandii TaxID=1137989 RepID=UPI001FE26800|nr:hypothetical protein [Geodermatophilus normandii]